MPVILVSDSLTSTLYMHLFIFFPALFRTNKISLHLRLLTVYVACTTEEPQPVAMVLFIAYVTGGGLVIQDKELEQRELHVQALAP